ncbi:MAG TPA: Holliday junction resolvase [Candidatus Thermoplasmatota archaeon]|jgi:Holliday junction resolvase|nr:Holliday junction resolvase [Candidatus Thermoplasmatota archaeon]
MALPGADYERELKGVLAGDAALVSAMARRCPAEQAARYEAPLARPFLVVRAAGSLGCDLIALSGDFSFPIEVKSSEGDTLRFSSNARLKEQIATMKRDCERAGVLPLYAFRRKGLGPRGGDPWRVFTLPSGQYRGRMRLVYDKLAKLDVSAEGNFIMRWPQGTPLSNFLGYLDALRQPLAPAPAEPTTAASLPPIP